jgi:hypothetical protein
MILDEMVRKLNPPTRRGRWCCEKYKEHGGDGKAKVMGVRIAESARRAGLWKPINNNKNGGLILAPIAYWTDEDVWEFHELRGIPHCCLYDEGFKRLGCIGCPLAGPEGQKRDFERWPKFEALWRKGFHKIWEQGHGKPTQKKRIVEFITCADGSLHAGNKITRKSFPENSPEWDAEWSLILDTNGEDPVRCNINGKLYGWTNERYFEKYLDPDTFFEWWTSGGAWEGNDPQCVFEDMMEQR